MKQHHYTIEKVDTLDIDFKRFLFKERKNLNEITNNKFDMNYAAIEQMLQKGVVFVCRKKGLITGFHTSWLTSSPLDVRVKLLHQQVFYVKPNSGKSAYLLFQKFIDFGRSHADHIITMIGKHTNVKSSTLKRWGFEEVETLYRMETK